MVHRLRRINYSEGSRPSRSLALSLQTSENFSTISAIKTTTGEIVTDPVEINSSLQTHYTGLLASEIPFDIDSSSLFFEGLDIPSLSQQERDLIDAPITLQELKAALNAMNKGKSPGNDGIPPELLLALWNQIGPLMLSMIERSVTSGAFATEANTALIPLLLNAPATDPSP